MSQISFRSTALTPSIVTVTVKDHRLSQHEVTFVCELSGATFIPDLVTPSRFQKLTATALTKMPQGVLSNLTTLSRTKLIQIYRNIESKVNSRQTIDNDTQVAYSVLTAFVRPYLQPEDITHRDMIPTSTTAIHDEVVISTGTAPKPATTDVPQVSQPVSPAVSDMPSAEDMLAKRRLAYAADLQNHIDAFFTQLADASNETTDYTFTYPISKRDFLTSSPAIQQLKDKGYKVAIKDDTCLTITFGV